MNFSECFARYGAKLANPQWAVSSRTESGEIVVSCWAHHLKKDGDRLRYNDQLSRWSRNRAGNNLLRRHLEEARSEGLPVRLVIARTDDTSAVDHGNNASGLNKTFAVRKDLIGEVTEFDGDAFCIEFRLV